MDVSRIQVNIRLTSDEYTRLCREQYRRRIRGDKASMRAIISDALNSYLRVE